MTEFNARLITKNDELTALEESTLALYEGEIVLAKIDVPQPDNTVAPTFVAKVGVDGKTFSQSPWLFAKASDVYSWAKKKQLDVDDIPALDIEKVNGLQEVLTECTMNKIWTGDDEPSGEYDVWIDTGDDVEDLHQIVRDEVNTALASAADSFQASKWKLLRDIVIPELPSLGTDGVAYCDAPYEERILCAFDTDYSGNKFSCTEFFIHVSGPATVPSGCGDLWAPGVVVANSNIPVYDANIANGITYHSTGISVGETHENSDYPYISGYSYLSVLSDGVTFSASGKPFEPSKVAMSYDFFVAPIKEPVQPWNSMAIGISPSEEHLCSNDALNVTTSHTFGFMPGTTIRVWGR